MESTSRMCDKNLLPNPWNEKFKKEYEQMHNKLFAVKKIRQNMVIPKKINIVLDDTKSKKKLTKDKVCHLPLTGTLHKPSNIHKLYGCWDRSLRFAEIGKYLETLIWNCYNPYIWLYCAKRKISSLSLSILNLHI